MRRLLSLLCVAALLTATEASLYAKRAQHDEEGKTTFPQSSHHTPAFNVVHVIAAVVGILGAAAIGITAFIMCRRRRRRRQQQNGAIEKSTSLPRPISSSSAASSTPSSTLPQQPQNVKSISTFDQFASAYCHDERQATNSSVATSNNDTLFIPMPSPPPPPYHP